MPNFKKGVPRQVMTSQNPNAVGPTSTGSVTVDETVICSVTAPAVNFYFCAAAKVKNVFPDDLRARTSAEQRCQILQES